MQPAGDPPLTLSDPSGCVEIMTGAVLADGADAVIRYEDIEIVDRGEEKYAKVLIDEVIVYNKALSESEIQHIYCCQGGISLTNCSTYGNLNHFGCSLTVTRYCLRQENADPVKSLLKSLCKIAFL